MNLNSLVKTGILFVFGICSTRISAQETLSLSLEEAIATALKNSLEIQIAKNEIEARTLLNHYGVAGGLPSVNATIGNTEQVMNIRQKLQNGTNIERDGAAGNNLNAGVVASLVLYNGNRIVSTKNRLEQLQAQSEEQLVSEIQNLIADVQTAYYDIVRQQSYVKTIHQSILASEKRLEVLEARKSAGMANNADIFQAQIDINTANQLLMNQDLVVEVAKTELLRLLSADPALQLQITDTIIVSKDIVLADIMERAARNADIRASENQIRITELLQKEIAAQRYPTVRLNAGLNYTRVQSAAGFNLLNQSFGPNVGLTVALPIYNGNAFKRQQQAASMDVKTSKNQKEILQRDFHANVYKTYHSYHNALKQLETETSNFKLTEDLLNLTMQRFELIQATIIDVREAQKSFEDAGYRLVNLSYAAKAAEIELKRLGNLLN
jgi:outer membrane protein